MPRGSYWSDPVKARRAAQAMKDAWRQKRYFVLEMPGGTAVDFATLEEIAPLVGRSVQTLKIYLARGGGAVTMFHNDNQFTLRRVMR